MKKTIKVLVILIAAFTLCSFSTETLPKSNHPLVGKWENINKPGEFKTFLKRKKLYTSIEKGGVEQKLLAGKFKVINHRMYTETFERITSKHQKGSLSYQYKKTSSSKTCTYNFSKDADTLILNEKEYFKRVK